MRNQINDFEEKSSYSNRQKRRTTQNLRFGCILFIIMAIISFIVLRFIVVAKCASADGFYESYSCEHGNRCCEPLPVHNPNQPWVN